MRVFIDISYDGTNYHGWQIQPNAVTVQEVVNKALATVLRQEVSTMGSGRTDTGVHARKQVAHAEMDYSGDLDDLIFKLNSFLPKDISVNGIIEVEEGKHARYDAQNRAYEYFINVKKSPFSTGQSWYLQQKLNLSAMKACCEILKKHDDFQSFCKSGAVVNNYKCNIMEAYWEESDSSLRFYIKANRFLQGMVRAIVGTMVDVGLGKTSINEFEKIIMYKDRKTAGASAPAQGLFLIEVNY